MQLRLHRLTQEHDMRKDFVSCGSIEEELLRNLVNDANKFTWYRRRTQNDHLLEIYHVKFFYHSHLCVDRSCFNRSHRLAVRRGLCRWLFGGIDASGEPPIATRFYLDSWWNSCIIFLLVVGIFIVYRSGESTVVGFAWIGAWRAPKKRRGREETWFNFVSVRKIRDTPFFRKKAENWSKCACEQNFIAFPLISVSCAFTMVFPSFQWHQWLVSLLRTRLDCHPRKGSFIRRDSYQSSE